MSLKQLNKISKRNQYSVYGWIREQEKLLKITHIPSMINVMCILYFRDDDTFDILSKNGVRLSSDNKMITKVGGCSFVGSECNNYGNMVIESESEYVLKWDLQIIKCSPSFAVFVGIASEQNPNTSISTIVSIPGHFIFASNQYKRRSEDTRWSIFGKFWNDGDKISIILDLKKGELSLMINDKDQGVALEDIPKSKDIKYRLFVTLRYDGDSVKILNFCQE